MFSKGLAAVQPDCFIMHLAMSGPKVAEDLGENEVVLQEGFIFMKNNRKEDENE